jgi:hypothetical protein
MAEECLLLGLHFMAEDAVAIANLALDLIGSRFIASLDEGTKESKAITRNYDSCRQAVLRDYPWNFATDRIILDTPDATPPAFGYTYRFALPLGFIRVHTVYDSSGCVLGPGTYTLESGWLFTDHSVVWLRFVFDMDDTTRFDPLFDEALSAYLAWKIAYLVSASETRQKELYAAYVKLLSKAKFVDTVEEPSRLLDVDEWIQARNGRGDFVRDPMT